MIGSNPDKVDLREIMNNLHSWNMNRIALVRDRGFVSGANIDYAPKMHYYVHSGGHHTSSEVDAWISKYQDGEVERGVNINTDAQGS